jgi:hypothetical protein
MDKNPKVFISYSHDNKMFENKILEFANKLRSEGIDANIDLYEEAPTEGWPKWMENQIRISDFVLVVITKSYYDKCYGENNKGKGVSWEVNIVYQYIYDNFSENKKFIPIFFNQDDEQYILTPLKPFTFYNVGFGEGYDKLYWRLRGTSFNEKPTLGKLRALPKKEKKTMYFTSPINVDLWDKAGWEGMVYLFCQNEKPIIGLLFKNYNAGIKIFDEWKKDSNKGYIDDFVDVVYIEPPFPHKCFVYSDIERNKGKGYFVHIGPNLDASINRLNEIDKDFSIRFITTVSRYQWMDELNGTNNRDFFKYFYDKFGEFSIMPVAKKNRMQEPTEDNLILGFEYSVDLHTVKFVKGIEVKEDDIYNIALHKPEN